MEKETKKPVDKATPYKPHLFEKQGGWFTYQDFYDRAANEMPDGGKFVEIGFFQGKSFLYFCERMKALGKNFEAVSLDVFLSDYAYGHCYTIEEAKELLAKSGFESQTKFIKGKSQDNAAMFADESINVLFIDGDHSYDAAKADIELYYPKLKRGGWIGIHDYGTIPEVTNACNGFFGSVVDKGVCLYFNFRQEYRSKGAGAPYDNVGTVYWQKP